jgi:hypothetical protein
VKRLVDAVNAIRNLADGQLPAGIDLTTFRATIARDLLDYAVVNYLLTNRHKVGGVLKIAGFIRETPVPAAGLRKTYLKREVMWSRVGNLLTDPMQGFKEVFEWNSSTPQLSSAIGELASVLESYDLQLAYFEPSGDLLTFINTGATTPLQEPLGFDLALDTLLGALDDFSAGIKLIVLPPTASRGPAIGFFPYARLNGVQEVPLSEALMFSIRGNADFTKGIAIILAPGQPVEAKTGFLGGTAGIPAEVQLGL